MTDRDYERAERRRRTREKGRITSIIAVGVIVLALIAIIVVVIALVGKHQPAAPAEETVAATEQPTLYIPSTTSPTPTERTAVQPTSPSYDETEAAPDAQDEPEIPDDADSDSDEDPDAAQGSASADGGALHFYVNGGTSGGYNWTYDSMGGVSVACQYNFDEGQYDFTLTGVSPGETSVTLIYYAADDQPVEVPLSVRVNDDLSVDLL
jgi:hypothetical protein